MVTRKDVFNTLRELGVKDGDILLFHSSLKSFGQVENGADTVIDGALDAAGPGEGLLRAEEYGLDGEKVFGDDAFHGGISSLNMCYV